VVVVPRTTPVPAIASSDVNQVKNRLQALGLLDRTFANASDDDLAAVIAALGDEHREALDELLGGEADAESVRAAITKGRIDGTMESIALVLTDACLADCIEELGPAADHPSSDQLRDVLPVLVERHGLAMAQMMLASTVAGEAPASAIIRDLLKNDELVKLPPAEPRSSGPILQKSAVDDAEREALKAKRKEMRKEKQEEARARREQAARAKRR
jgi:hypothetical protein